MKCSELIFNKHKNNIKNGFFYKALMFIVLGCFGSICAMQGGSSASARHSEASSSHSPKNSVLNKLDDFLKTLSAQDKEKILPQDLVALLYAQGLSIATDKTNKPMSSELEKPIDCKTVAVQTDPVFEWAYEPTFARSFPSTERKTEAKLLELIRKETKGISASLYEINSYAVAYELCKKHQEGVSVRLILEDGCHVNSALLLLKHCRVPMKVCTVSGGILHQKVFRFDANKGKRILFDIKHVKDKTVLDILGKLNLDNAHDKKLLDAYNEAIDRAVPFYWDGSFNITGVADQKNRESTTVVSDESGYPEKKKEFDELWVDYRHCSLKRTQDKLASLAGAEFKDTELALNGVPSKNVFYLLKSKINIDGQNGLTLESVLNHKDFVPKKCMGDLPLLELIPSAIELPFSCYMRIRCENLQNVIEVRLKDDSWVGLMEALRRAQEIEITKYRLRLHGIGNLVDANLDHWCFRRRGSDDLYRLADLQACDEDEVKKWKFVGPYDVETREMVKIGKQTPWYRRKHKNGYSIYDYTLQALKVAAIKDNGSLADVLKEYK